MPGSPPRRSAAATRATSTPASSSPAATGPHRRPAHLRKTAPGSPLVLLHREGALSALTSTRTGHQDSNRPKKSCVTSSQKSRTHLETPMH
jgi:hypothetical protein